MWGITPQFLREYFSCSIPNLSFISPSTMLDTTDMALRVRSRRLSVTTEHVPTAEFLRRLRCLTSPRCFEDHGHLSSLPPINRANRCELLNDVSCRESRVFRSLPCPPRGRRSSINATGPTEARNTPPLSEGQGNLGILPAIDRVGRRELLNDVTVRKRRVFPCPPLGRRFSE